MYLGPVVVAQQVLDPSPQTRYPRKEKKGGGGGGGHIRYSQVFRSLIPGSRYRLPLKMLRVRSFFIFSLSRKYVLRTYQVVINLIFGGKNL